MLTSIDFSSTKLLLENSKLFYIICVDPSGNYSYINSRYADAFAHVDNNFVGKPYYITMHPDDIVGVQHAGGMCYQHPGKLFPATIRKHNGKGGYVVTQWEFCLMVDNGQPSGVFCLGYDITEFEEVKDTVVQINGHLAQKNEILTEIAFEQSHLVRAPLANVMGLAELLHGMDLGAEANNLIELMLQSCGKLDHVIRETTAKIRS